MPRTLFTALIDAGRRRSYLFALICLTIAATTMTALPLVGVLGYEFAFLMGVLVAFAAGVTSSLHFSRRRSEAIGVGSSETSIGAELFCMLVLNLFLLIPPFLIMSAKGLITGLCNFEEATSFYLLIPVITSLLATAVGALCGLTTARGRYAWLMYIGYALIVIATSVYRLLTEPPVFAYNDLVGYFPGPIYDEVIRLTSTLIIARSLVLLEVVVLIMGIVLTVNPSSWRLEPRRLLRPMDWPRELGLSLTRLGFLAALIALLTTSVYRAQLGIVIDREHIQTVLGGFKRTEHFDIYYDLNSDTGKRIDLIALDHEFQYDQLRNYLEVTADFRITSFIYATPDQKKRLMGARFTSIERPGSDEMHLNDAGFPHPVMKHELAHVLSSDFGNRLYGGSYMMGYHEGLASAADWRVDTMTLHQWSKAMRQLNLAPPLSRILGTVGFWSEAPSRSYTLTGSFVRFVISSYGISGFKQAFPDGDLEGAFGRPLSEMIAEWESFIDAISLTESELNAARQRFHRPSIFRRHCPHEVAALMDEASVHYRQGRYGQSIRYYEQVLDLEPENPSALRGLMLGLYRDTQYNRSAAVADTIISDERRTVRILASALLKQGDISWLRGELSEARSRYLQALDRRGNDAMEREAMIKIAALDLPEVRDNIIGYLTSDQSEATKDILLMQAIQRTPDFAIAHYLMARRLYNGQDYEMALPYLQTADSLSTANLVLDGEIARLLAHSYFHTGAYTTARAVFSRIAASTNSSARMVWAESWLARCDWFNINGRDVQG